jgi:hypothetical protein
MAAVWEPLFWSTCVHQLEGRADGRSAVAQRQTWCRLVILDSHSAGDGAVVPGMVAQGRRRWRRRTSLV